MEKSEKKEKKKHYKKKHHKHHKHESSSEEDSSDSDEDDSKIQTEAEGSTTKLDKAIAKASAKVDKKKEAEKVEAKEIL